jgi:cyclopropane-fatty-acyl-phospholipid synthase
MNAPERITIEPAIPLAGRALLKLLERLQVGQLTLVTPDGERIVFSGSAPGPVAEMEIRDWRALAAMVKSADIGMGEAWRDGWIDSPALTPLLSLFLANQKAFEGAWYGGPVARLVFSILHKLRPNTRAGAKKNIHAHYDLGNAFYALWLDRTMSYSAALFTSEGQDFEQAQEAKYERILDELAIDKSHHVLEIGCGWGGFAEYAARTRGCRITGVTISREQLAFAKERIARAGLESLVTLSFTDYRDITGSYDRVVSIEMVEAVGERYWKTFYRTLFDRLKPGGRGMLQAITIDEEAFASYRGTSDFIREYVFPGGMLAPVGRMAAHAREAGLTAGEPFCFGLDYAETLRRWHASFKSQSSGIQALGFDSAFLRLWEFYLCYCEAGFVSGRVDVVHLGFERPA